MKTKKSSIEIPTSVSGEVVEVFFDELEASEEAVVGVCELIASEQAPATLYLDLARHSLPILAWIFEPGLKDTKLRAPDVAVELLGMRAMSLLVDTQQDVDSATQLLNQAERLDNSSPDLWARKGLLLLVKSHKDASVHGKQDARVLASVEAAEIQFRAILEREKDSLIGKVGLALCCYAKGDHVQAIDRFKALAGITATKSKSLARDIQLCLANCLARNNMYKEAVKQLERMDEQDPDVIKSLGVLMVTQGLITEGPSALHTGLQYLKKFYTNHSKQDATVCILLADHFFMKKEYEKAEQLGKTAYESAGDDQLKAKASYLLGKISHSKGLYDEAFTRYLTCVKLDSHHQAGQFGLAQMYVKRKDVASGIRLLEQIKGGSGYQVQALLGVLLVQRYGEITDPALLDRAFTCFSTLPEQYVNSNPQLMLAIASVLEDRQPERAFELYGKLLRDHPVMMTVPRRMNMAILGLHLNVDNPMEKCKLQAEDFINFTDDNSKFLLALLTLASDKQRLESMLREINCRSSLLHLAYSILIPSKRYAEAMDIFKELIGVDEADIEAWHGMALCHLHQRAFTPSRKSFERILMISKHDIPAICGLAVVYVELSRRRLAEGDPNQHKNTNLKRALEFAGKALALNPKCTAAANVACVALLDLGYPVSTYKDGFALLARGIDQSNMDRLSLDIVNNHAIACTEANQFEEAQVLLQTSIQKDDQRIPIFTLLYGRAAYAQGKATNDPKHFIRAIDVLSKQKIDDPVMNGYYQFDLGLCHQEAGLGFLKTSSGLPPNLALEQLDAALENVQRSLELFNGCLMFEYEELKELNGQAQKRLQYSQSLLPMIQKKREELASREQARTLNLALLAEERRRREEEERAREQAVLSERLRLEAEVEAERKRLAKSIAESSNVEINDDSSPKRGTTERKLKTKKMSSPTKKNDVERQLSKDLISDSDMSDTGMDIDGDGSQPDKPVKDDDEDELDELFE